MTNPLRAALEPLMGDPDGCCQLCDECVAKLWQRVAPLLDRAVREAREDERNTIYEAQAGEWSGRRRS